MRVAFHAINGIGLGHLVRAVNIAREMPSGTEILVITNAADTSLLDAAKLDFVQMPPRLLEPHLDLDRASAALPEHVEEAVLFSIFERFAPDLVVFDTHAPMRVVARLPSIQARAALVLRELRPETLETFLARGDAHAFDRIIVPHSPDEVTPLPHLPYAAIGPIVRPMTPKSPRKSFCVAMMGGGGQPVDGRRYALAVADAHHLAKARVPDLETILVTGPYGVRPDVTYPGLTILRNAPNLPELLAEASLVVSQAGYNAIAEIRSLRLPAVLIPGYRKAEDQRVRARRLVDAGAAVIAKPEARSIATQIETLFRAPEKLAAMRAAHPPFTPGNRLAAVEALRPLQGQPGVKKVVLVAHDYPPKLGGMETVARALAEGLVAERIDVRVYTSKRLGLDPKLTVPLYTPRVAPGRIDLWNDLLLTIDALLRDTPDVIHLCHAGLAPWVPILRAAFPARVTIHVHGNDLVVPWVHHAMEPEDYRKLQIDGLRAADAVVCVSSFSHGLAERSGVTNANLHTVANGVDHAHFSPGAAVPDEDEVLLTVSRLAPRKGHRTVLRAIARLNRPRLKYIFTGESETMRTELATLARELHIADRVVATGFVTDKELAALYRRATAFVLLVDDLDTDVEGFGVSLLEAAASGLPTIASRTGGMPEAIVDGETGLLVSPGNVEEAARAIDWVLEHPDAAREMGRRGRGRVVDGFSHQRTTARILGIWQSLPERSLDKKSAPLCGPFPVENVVELVRHAQQYARQASANRARRQATFREVTARGQIVRLRATGDGSRLLPEALADCAAIGIEPRIEVKLRRFLDPDFQDHGLPLIGEIELAHGVPHASANRLMNLLANAPIEKVRVVRLFLTHEARADAKLAVTAIPETHALRRFFAERGVTVVPPPELMRYLSETPAGGPETGMIEPTNLCNLACPTCPTGTGKIKPLPQMTLGRFDQVLGELTPRLRNVALWNYGEPLLNKELPQMIAHAKSAGVNVVKVSSNVHFLDGARGLALLQSGLDVLILSVDGASQATYATFRKDGDFEKVATSVAWLCAEKKRLGLKKPRIELQFIAMRHNEHELPEMQRLAKEWGADVLRVKTVGADDDATRDLVPATRLLSRYEPDGKTPNVRHPFCTMAWDHTVINVDGSVTPCCYLRPDMGDSFVMGNVFETPFVEIWRGEKYRAFRSAMLTDRSTMPVCDRCRGGTHDLVAAHYEVT